MLAWNKIRDNISTVFKTNELVDTDRYYGQYTNLLSNISRKVVAKQPMLFIAIDKTLIWTKTSNLGSKFFLIIGMPRTYFLGHRGIVLCIIMVTGKCILLVAFLVNLFYYFAFPFVLSIHNCCGFFMGGFFCRRCELLLWVTFPVCLVFLDDVG